MHQCVAQHQTGSARHGNGRQFEGTVRHDEAQEPVAVPAGHHIPADRANGDAVVEQRVNRPDAEQNSAGETLQRDADVVLHVKPGHRGPLFAESEPARGFLFLIVAILVFVRRIHRVVLLQLLGGDQPRRQARIRLNHGPGQSAGDEKQDRRREEIVDPPAKQLRKTGRQKVDDRREIGRRRRVKGAVAAGDQGVQITDEALSPIARPDRRQIVRQLPEQPRIDRDVLGPHSRQRHAGQSPQQRFELPPGTPPLTQELPLVHRNASIRRRRLAGRFAKFSSTSSASTSRWAANVT